MRILIVDDDPACLEALEELLVRDHEVRIAVNADLALTWLAREHFDLAVLDYNLPDDNGLNLFRRIRMRRTDLPVIMISGYIDNTGIDAAGEGILAFFTKPLNIKTFLDTLNRIDVKKKGNTHGNSNDADADGGKDAGGSFGGQISDLPPG